MAKLDYRACWRPGCTARASFGDEGSAKSVSCKFHARKGMVHLDSGTQCAHKGCCVLSTRTAEGAKNRAFCPAHARPPIPPVHSNRCSHAGCSRDACCHATPSDNGTTPSVSFCLQHVPSAPPVSCITSEGCARNTSLGMEASQRVNGGSSLFQARQRYDDHASKRTFFSLSTKTCTHGGCRKRPSYGMEGSKRPEACAGHAREGMVNVVSKRCSHEGCAKISTFGVKGSTKREFCSQHAERGMVTVGRKMCAHEKCFKFPTYGHKGSTKRQFCAPHAPAGMIDFTRKCAIPACYTVAKIRATGGRRTRKFCAIHASEGNTTKEINNKCRRPGCRKSGTFSVDGGKTLQFCGEHAGRDWRHPEDSMATFDPLSGAYTSQGFARRYDSSSGGSSGANLLHVPLPAADGGSPTKRARVVTIVSPTELSAPEVLDSNTAAIPAPPGCRPPPAGRGPSAMLNPAPAPRYGYTATTDSWPTVALLQTSCGWSKWNWRSARASAIRSINESAEIL